MSTDNVHIPLLADISRFLFYGYRTGFGAERVMRWGDYGGVSMDWSGLRGARAQPDILRNTEALLERNQLVASWTEQELIDWTGFENNAISTPAGMKLFLKLVDYDLFRNLCRISD